MYTYKVLHFFYYRSKLTPSNQINPCTLICKYLHLDRVNRLACETTFHLDAKSVWRTGAMSYTFTSNIAWVGNESDERENRGSRVAG